jgi:hypothetical protein
MAMSGGAFTPFALRALLSFRKAAATFVCFKASSWRAFLARFSTSSFVAAWHRARNASASFDLLPPSHKEWPRLFQAGALPCSTAWGSPLPSVLGGGRGLRPSSARGLDPGFR